jgi:hypothetical protein
MRRFLIVLATLVVCSAPTWADSITYDVNAWATITAPNNLTENVNVSFLWMNNLNLPNGYDGPGVVSGSLNVTSSGFLGTFTAYDPTGINALYLPLDGAQSLDQIDLYYPNWPPMMAPGSNTLGFQLTDCESTTCINAYGNGWVYGESPNAINMQEGSTVSTVNVPDGDSSFLLSITVLGVFALAWRWRRREV